MPRIISAMAVAAGFALTSSVALAVNFPAQPFLVTPVAIGEAFGPFNATYINFNYSATVIQNAAGAFTESGTANFTAFSFPGLNNNLAAGTTGLNLGPGTTGYNLLGVFQATGNAANNTAGGVNVTFTSFNLQLFADTDRNGTGDIQVGTGSLNVGAALVFPGLAAGNFDVILNYASIGGFMTTGSSAVFTLGDLNGDNTTLTGFAPVGTAFTGTITGSGNFSTQNNNAVPEPAALLLLGSGLAGLGLLRRRRKE